MCNILAIIPARSGSKSVPNKNIRLMNGKPMLAYSIEHAKQSKFINRILVSTDSAEYAEIARNYGAEVPFLRPAEYAQDTSLDIDVFYHVLMELKEKEGYEADIVVQLRPTCPVRKASDIDAMIQWMLSDEACDSVRSITKAKEIPYKMWLKSDGKRVSPFVSEIPECYNMPRQELPVVYYQNASIDIIRPRVILEERSMTGQVIYGYEMDEIYDIDTEEEWKAAEEKLKRDEIFQEIAFGKKRFVFDIDGVIAKLHPSNQYDAAEPNQKMIDLINRLYEYGNEIILHTARGYVTGIDWKTATEEQLKKWELNYHELHFGKPNADFYVDDRMLGMDYLMQLMGEHQQE